MIKTILVLTLVVMLVECFNAVLGMAVFAIKDTSSDGLSDFEEEHQSLIQWGGLLYWTLKLILFPILIPYRASKKKQAVAKEKQAKLLRNIDCFYGSGYGSNNPIRSINLKIEQLEKSINQDLYLRALDSHKDMMAILIKCSDGEGNIDTHEFSSIIKEAVQECKEVVEVAYEEHENRLKQANRIHCDNKKEEIKKNLEDMKNKNREFKDMWRKKQ